MKVRVEYSDGEFRGGLFKTQSHNALNCRTWQGPPHPDYAEMLIDIAGKNNPCHEGSWFRLQIAKVPDITGPPDGSDDFDANSRAFRISAGEAKAWLERNQFPVPADLLDFLSQESGTPSKPSATALADPLPDGLQEAWDALSGKVVTAKQLGQTLGISEDAARKRLSQLSELGYPVRNRRGAGYFRGDASSNGTAEAQSG